VTCALTQLCEVIKPLSKQTVEYSSPFPLTQKTSQSLKKHQSYGRKESGMSFMTHAG